MPTNVFGEEIVNNNPNVLPDDFLSTSFKLDELEKVEGGQPAATKTSATPAATPAAPVKKPVATKTAPAKTADGEEEETEEEKNARLEASAKSALELFQAAPKDEPAETEGKEEEEETKEEETEETQFSALSKELYKLNIFQAELDEQGNETPVVANTAEEFKTLFEEQSNSKGAQWIDGFLTRFGDDKKDFFHAVFINGVDPHKYFSIASSIEKLEGLDLANESNQERVVREFYRRSGMSEENVDKSITRFKDTAELQNQAEQLHPLVVEQDKNSLFKLEETKKAQLQQEQRNDAQYKASVAKILRDKLTEKEFDGIAVNDKVAQKAFDFIYAKNWKTPDGTMLTDLDVWFKNLDKPENHPLKVKLALMAINNLDLSKVKQKALTNEVNTLFQNLKTKQVKSSSTIKQAQQKDSWADALK